MNIHFNGIINKNIVNKRVIHYAIAVVHISR